jgi:hypothetical protein
MKYGSLTYQKTEGHFAAKASRATTMKSALPILTTGQLFLHSCLHFFGLHLSALTMAIRVSLSAIFAAAPPAGC